MEAPVCILRVSTSNPSLPVLSCSRQCQPPFPPPPAQQHSPMSSQASSAAGPLLPGSLPPLPAPSTAQPPVPPGQQLTPDAFAIVERAQQMVEMLSEENHVLRQELEGYYEKADKLQKVRGDVGIGNSLSAPAFGFLKRLFMALSLQWEHTSDQSLTTASQWWCPVSIIPCPGAHRLLCL